MDGPNAILGASLRKAPGRAVHHSPARRDRPFGLPSSGMVPIPSALPYPKLDLLAQTKTCPPLAGVSRSDGGGQPSPKQKTSRKHDNTSKHLPQPSLDPLDRFLQRDTFVAVSSEALTFTEIKTQYRSSWHQTIPTYVVGTADPRPASVLGKKRSALTYLINIIPK
jgi:hypothetical protein